jgi:hypothetical protein
VKRDATRDLKRAAPLLFALLLGGCGFRDCQLGIAEHDCRPPGSALADFPQDDAVCRGYGLVPGTHAYDVCRQTKHHERKLTARETDYGVLREPLTPAAP